MQFDSAHSDQALGGDIGGEPAGNFNWNDFSRAQCPAYCLSGRINLSVYMLAPDQWARNN